MKKLIAIAAIGTLAACGSADEPEEAVAEETVVETGEATGSPAGTYEATLADGSTITQTINEDGTYRDVANGEEVESGNWRTDGDQLCFDPEGDEPEACFTGGDPAADGSFDVMDGDGNVTMTVRKVEAPATMDAAPAG